MIDFESLIGELCVQVEVTESTTSMLYWYRDRADDPKHYKALCRMKDYVVKPESGGWSLCTHVVAELTGTIQCPVAIYNRHCSWEDLCAMRDLWQKKKPDSPNWFEDFDTWLNQILADDQIPFDLKGRLQIFALPQVQNLHAPLLKTVDADLMGVELLCYSMLAGPN